MVIAQTAAATSHDTGRSRGGWTDGEPIAQPAAGSKSASTLASRPKSWWSHGRTLSAAEVLAEVVVVARTAVMSSSTTGRSHGGWTDGRHRQSQHKRKSQWLGRRPWREAAAQAEAGVVAQTDAMVSRRIGGSRGGWADGCDEQFCPGRSCGGWAVGRSGQSRHRLKSSWLEGRPS